MGLLPVTMASLLKNDKLDEALGIGLSDCISCAACSYACPSNIPLVHYFNYGKGEVVAKREAKRKDEEIKRLIEEHRVRMAAIEREKAEAAAKRQAAMEKQKAEKAAA
jgi:electron transport complex protein RnfC